MMISVSVLVSERVAKPAMRKGQLSAPGEYLVLGHAPRCKKDGEPIRPAHVSKPSIGAVGFWGSSKKK